MCQGKRSGTKWKSWRTLWNTQVVQCLYWGVTVHVQSRSFSLHHDNVYHIWSTCFWNTKLSIHLLVSCGPLLMTGRNFSQKKGVLYFHQFLLSHVRLPMLLMRIPWLQKQFWMTVGFSRKKCSRMWDIPLCELYSTCGYYTIQYNTTQYSDYSPRVIIRICNRHIFSPVGTLNDIFFVITILWGKLGW